MLLKYLLVPLACILELNWVQSLQCSVWGNGSTHVPSIPNEGRAGGQPSWEVASGALCCHIAWLPWWLCPLFPSCVGASSQVRGPAWGLLLHLETIKLSCCSSAFEEQRVEPEPCPTSKHQADGSRSPAVHCYPHFSMLCSWEARCTDWIPLGFSGELGS